MQEDDLHILSQIKSTTDYFSKAKLLNIVIYQRKNKLKDVAAAIGIKPAYVCHILRLNRLSELIMDGYYAKLISISHLFIISLLKSQEEQNKLYELILRDNLTVQQSEEHVRGILHGVTSEGEYIGKNELSPLVAQAEKTQNASIKCIQTRIKTKITVEWKGTRAQRKEQILSFLRTLANVS